MSVKNLFLYFSLFLNLAITKSSAQETEGSRVIVFGSEDYRSDLFNMAPNVPWNHPFSVDFQIDLINHFTEVNDSSAVYPYIAISVDTVKSNIREDFEAHKDLIGKTILDIIELHRRELVQLYTDELQNIKFSEIFPAMLEISSAVIINLSLGVEVIDTYRIIEKYEIDSNETWFVKQRSILKNCHLMLAQYEDKLEELTSTDKMSIDSVLFKRFQEVHVIRETNPKAITEFFRKRPLGYSLHAGTQFNRFSGIIESPLSFRSVFPYISFDIHYDKIYFFATMSGLSIRPQKSVQLGDVRLRENGTHIGLVGSIGLGYAFRIHRKLRIIPEINMTNITFIRSLPSPQENLVFDFDMWGWGIHIIPPSFKKEIGTTKRNLIRGYIETSFFFRHLVYKLPNIGNGNIYTLGVGVSIRNDFYRKKLGN